MKKKRNCTIGIVKTKVLTCVVTAKLICTSVFAYAKCWFSRDVAQINMYKETIMSLTNGHPVLYNTGKPPIGCWYMVLAVFTHN